MLVILPFVVVGEFLGLINHLSYFNHIAFSIMNVALQFLDLGDSAS